MSSTGHSHPGDGHHHHHPHRHHPPVRSGVARPDRPAASLLALSLGARLGAAALLTAAIWTMIGWAVQ